MEAFHHFKLHVPSKSALGIPTKETETEDVDFKRISHSDILKSRKKFNATLRAWTIIDKKCIRELDEIAITFTFIFFLLNFDDLDPRHRILIS